MNEIQVFENSELGKVRVTMIDGIPYFFGVDIATALLYERPSKAISDNCKGILTKDTFRNKGGYPEKLIPEGDMYRLVVKASTQSNDWEQIGKDTKKLQSLVDRLEEVKKELDKKKEESKASLTADEEFVGNETENEIVNTIR